MEVGLWVFELRRLDAGEVKAGVSPFLSANGGSCPDRLPRGSAGPPQSGLSPQEGAPGPHSMSPPVYRCSSQGLGGALAGPGPRGSPRWPRAWGWGALAGPGCCWSCCSPSQPCRSGAGFGSKTASPRPASLCHFSAPTAALLSSACVTRAPLLCSPQVSSRLFTAC